MFTSKKNLQIIDYQNSYYCRQQRKKRRYKWLKISFLLLLVISLTILATVFSPYAQSNQLYSEKEIKRDNPFIHGPQLLFSAPSSEKNQYPTLRKTLPVDIEANININGLVAYAEIKQTFINPYAITLEGKYQFPLPENSAVKQLVIKVGDKEIVGEIMEKKLAKSRYLKAQKQGKKASLVAQHRPNLFTNTIANIPAQSTVIVTLKFIMPISFSNGHFNFRLPLALTDRYQSTSTSSIAEHLYNQSHEHLLNHESSQKTNRTPQPFNQTSTRSFTSNLPSVARSQSSININLNSGIPITNIFSNSHKIRSRPLNSQQSAYFITLNKAQMVSNKNFDLNWQLIANNQPQMSSFTQEVSGEHYTLITLFPPKIEAAKVIARDIIFIIDTSGSMQGDSMEQAKASLQLALLQLNDKDSFNIIAFDNDANLLFPKTQMASLDKINKAQNFINNLRADGGTEMYQPLSNALMMKKNKEQSAEAIRQIVFITDGAVANEYELMQLLNNAQGDFRLYTVGIGAAPNGYFMKKAAKFGRGSYVYIQKQSEVQQKITQFMTKISQPALTNITLSVDNLIHQQVETFPKRIPDLHLGEPLQIALKSHDPITSIQLEAATVSTPFYQQLIIDEQQLSKGISSLWARRKIESLLDSLIVGADKEKVKSQVIATSLNHQIISPYTSFIAVEKQPDISSSLAKNKLSATKKSLVNKAKNDTIQAHETLLVSMPQTSLGWQQQFMVGLVLLLLASLFVRVSDTTHQISNYFQKTSRHEEDN